MIFCCQDLRRGHLSLDGVPQAFGKGHNAAFVAFGLINVEAVFSYHAGFGDQGFLYSEAGTCTLVWSAYDPDFEALVGKHNPWVLSREKQQILENALRPAPDGSRWLFSNPARCLTCGHPISGPMSETIYYLEYEGSISVDPLGRPGAGLKDVLKRTVEQGAGRAELNSGRENRGDTS